MLYDPKWEKKTKADHFTLESLIAWLEKQPADEQYEFCEWNNCLLAQWLRSMDPKAHVVGPNGFLYSALGQTVDLMHLANIVHAGSFRSRHLHTFGAALERARAVSQHKGTTE